MDNTIETNLNKPAEKVPENAPEQTEQQPQQEQQQTIEIDLIDMQNKITVNEINVKAIGEKMDLVLNAVNELKNMKQDTQKIVIKNSALNLEPVDQMEQYKNLIKKVHNIKN